MTRHTDDERAAPSARLTPRAGGLARLALAGLLLTVGLFTAFAAPAQSLQSIPPLKARVTDLSGTLSPQQVDALEAMLADLERSKGAQVAVLMVPTTQPEAIEQYGIRVAEAWKLGRGKERAQRATGDPNAAPVDDGLLLLIAKQDRRLRIEVGYGLEGAITDGIAKRIIDESISPRFRSGDYFGGIQAGLQDLRARIEGEDLPPAWERAAAGQESNGGFGFIPVLVFSFVAGTILSSVAGRLLGAGAGGLGAGLLGASAIGAGWLAVGAALIVFILVLLIAPGGTGLRQAGRHTYRNGPVILPGGWGGRGGSGGGGFGGGGGGFGGGGASGGW